MNKQRNPDSTTQRLGNVRFEFHAAGSASLTLSVLSMKVRAATESDRCWAAAVVAQYFGTSEIISRGVRHDTRVLPGLIGEIGGERLGLAPLTFLRQRRTER